MPEISAPAFSMEGLIAAVQSGAGSVYIRVDEKPAKKARSVFSASDIGSASEYCRIRGVKLRVLLDKAVYDSGFSDALALAEKAQYLGADALIVSDFGLLRALRSYLPEMPLHLSAEGGVHNLDGALFAKKLGASRVSLAPELPKERICFIARNAGIETEISCFGPLCMSYKGQCFLGSVAPHIKSGGECGMPCLAAYAAAGKSGVYPLSLKKNNLFGDIGNLKLCEVTAVRIDGMGERPEFIAALTGAAYRAFDCGRVSDADAATLDKLIPRGSTTNAFFDGDKGAHMLLSPEAQPLDGALFAELRSAYTRSELPRIPLRYYAVIHKNETVKLGAQDELGNVAAIEGPPPEPAFHRATTKVTLQTQLYRAKDTPYTPGSLRCSIDDEVYVPREKLEPLQRSLFSELTAKRRILKPRPVGSFTPTDYFPGYGDAPKMTISVLRASQLSPELAAKKPDTLIVPLGEFFSYSDSLLPFFTNGATTVAVSLPHIIWDGEDEAVRRQLLRASALGVKDLFVSNPGHLRFGEKLGFALHGDPGLCVTNSETLDIYKNAGLVSAALPFDLSFQQLRSISKCIDSELVVYGRLPLMLTENCIIKNSSGVCSCSRPSELRDKGGSFYPVIRSSGCRNIVYSPSKLFLADRQRQYASLGLRAARLMFTTENARECLAVAERYLGESEYEPNGYFRGLYGRA